MLELNYPSWWREYVIWCRENEINPLKATSIDKYLQEH